jgi:hypothetical protein
LKTTGWRRGCRSEKNGQGKRREKRDRRKENVDKR